jgi:hypothetical protein
MIEIQFGKWHRSHPLLHCSILSKERVAEVLKSGENEAVVTVRTTGGRVLALFPSALSWEGRKIAYGEIEGHEWIDLEHAAKARNKAEHFDRLHLITASGVVTIEGLGQAVFPLMKSLEMIQKKSGGRARDQSATPFECPVANHRPLPGVAHP